MLYSYKINKKKKTIGLIAHLPINDQVLFASYPKRLFYQSSLKNCGVTTECNIKIKERLIYPYIKVTCIKVIKNLRDRILTL